MYILWTIILGFIVGVIARFIYPGRQRMGWILTILLGIGGAFVATYLGQWLHIYRAGETAGFIGAIIGALIILFIYNLVRRTAPPA
jgi:uncharacterized membrane protein YeaQ/YmgE (transglycosylase-associated protein family)